MYVNYGNETVFNAANYDSTDKVISFESMLVLASGCPLSEQHLACCANGFKWERRQATGYFSCAPTERPLELRRRVDQILLSGKPVRIYFITYAFLEISSLESSFERFSFCFLFHSYT